MIHDHNLDNLHQSAYKKGHSTETALLSIKNLLHWFSLIYQLRLTQLTIPHSQIAFIDSLVLEVLFTTPLSSIISQHTSVKFHFYADDTQLYIHLAHNNVPQAFEKLNSCLMDVKDWISKIKLKLNPQKTEFIVFG